MRAAWVLMLLLSGCAKDAFSELPPLDGFQTLLAGARDDSPLIAVSLPREDLRFDLPGEAIGGAHGDIVLYAKALPHS